MAGIRNLPIIKVMKTTMKMRMKKRYLSAMVGLGLGMAATATAQARTWTDVSGKHSVEAEFVALAGDKVTLKTLAGKITSFPLANLSEADRAFAKAQAGGGGAVAAGPMTTTATVSLQESISIDGDGKQTSSHNLVVKVELHGGDAAAAYSMGPFKAEPLTVGGKNIEMEEPFSIGDFETIDHSKEGFFAEHPKDGVRVEIEYAGVAKDMAKVDLVKGTVKVLTGGTAKEVVLDDLLKRAAGPIVDPGLAKMGLALKFDRQSFEDQVSLSVSTKIGAKGLVGLELVDADGKPAENMGGGTGSDGRTMSHSISVEKADLAGLKLKILFRDGGEEKTLPFEVRDVAVEK